VIEKEQQLLWLEEIYPSLEKIAQAIIVDSRTAAEDVTSNAVAKVLIQIEKGKTFESKGKFFAYVKLAVRRCSSEYYTKYKGDVVRDVAKSNLIKEMRPSIRRTPVYNIDVDADDFNPFERYEDADFEVAENKCD
jgi:hypothetical protein